MKSEITGITRANEGMQGMSWTILGQTYVPKSCVDHSFSWHATLPPGTFVPPHIHPDQDEYLYMLEGKLDFMLGGADAQATPGDLIRLGMGVPHGIFNKSDQTAKVLFWVSPTQKLYDLFWGLHNMKEQKPEDVVAIAAVSGNRFCSYAISAWRGCSERASVSARQRASRMACDAPFDPTGYIGCAASPSSVTRPVDQYGKGSRSQVGYS